MRSMDSSIASLISDLETRLQPHTDTPQLDAQVLLAHVLNQPRSWIMAHPEKCLTPVQFESLLSATSRLEKGEPLPYILGHWQFYGLDFQITPDVLIPRPETELLVDRAIDWLYANPSRRWAADIATGSGCIAVALASKLPDLKLLATDLSLPALDVARSNASQHNVTNHITFMQADLLDFSPPVPFDLICANLPYIPSSTLPSLAVAQHEPHLALDGGHSGLELIRRLLVEAPSRLSPVGLILLEIEASQGPDAQSLANHIFPGALVNVYPDLSGRDRLLEIQFTP